MVFVESLLATLMVPNYMYTMIFACISTMSTKKGAENNLDFGGPN